VKQRNEGNDYAAGTGAANTLYGGGGADRLLGNGGDDIIIADYADLTAGNVQGDDGLDALIYDSPERLVLDASARSFEIVRAAREMTDSTFRRARLERTA
jgi:hypothetical protein